MRGIEKLRPLAPLLLRVDLGVIFIYKGHPKLFGHTDDSMREMVQDGLPAYFAYIAGVLELGEELCSYADCTRDVGLLLAGEMAVAMWKGEHLLAHPLAVDQYEFALALGAGAFALATLGCGPIFSRYLSRQRKTGATGDVW